MRSFLILAALSALPQCQGDETVRAYGAGDKTWHLVKLDGKPFDARATLTFPETGKIAGLAPCNAYSAAMTVPYPWFDTGHIAVTRRACPDLAGETAFLDALTEVTISDVLGDTMILSDDSGERLVFKAAD
ncbi:META domain-containing protein [Sulfitobacter sp. KE29]|uniref:META domain-containing protein n=1 Tax=Sulfitobacter TaxID=60136 RepID=UPI0007C21A4E|nr:MULTISPECIES: META domain-containing protein [Sulfitobacter]KZY51938.1 META domain-containing protein [Sulfitobacter sp. HI0054]MBO9437941.1 META domain-containing protein [Sulfitobacter sp. R18_2]MDF3418748.1 META domain-containing protein [Sulfitobacter sp. Ks38]MDF3426167.1 META domain-containing protein [Sulfitobacter sp. KE29]MDF3429747.1 META domain-containing protein [Sulfitobacter sp. S46]